MSRCDLVSKAGLGSMRLKPRTKDQEGDAPAFLTCSPDAQLVLHTPLAAASKAGASLPSERVILSWAWGVDSAVHAGRPLSQGAASRLLLAQQAFTRRRTGPTCTRQ